MKCSINAPQASYRPVQPNRAERNVTRARNLLLMLLVCGIAACGMVAVAGAQTPAPSAGAFTPKADATLLQLMRGMMFPESNVVFAGQEDVDKIPRATQPALSPNLLTSVFGGWPAVENSSLALAESADQLMVPGRTCDNGKPVPVTEAAWVKYVTGMRSAALDAYKTAKSKNTDDMVDAAGAVSDACMACHNIYRSNRAGIAGRCTATPPSTPQNPPANLPANLPPA